MNFGELVNHTHSEAEIRLRANKACRDVSDKRNKVDAAEALAADVLRKDDGSVGGAKSYVLRFE